MFIYKIFLYYLVTGLLLNGIEQIDWLSYNKYSIKWTFVEYGDFSDQNYFVQIYSNIQRSIKIYMSDNYNLYHHIILHQINYDKELNYNQVLRYEKACSYLTNSNDFFSFIKNRTFLDEENLSKCTFLKNNHLGFYQASRHIWLDNKHLP